MITHNDKLDELLIKTWLRVGCLPELVEASKISEEEVIQEIFSRDGPSKGSALDAVDSIMNNPDFLSNPNKIGEIESRRYSLFEKIKKTIDAGFDEIYDTMFLDILFEQNPASFEREKERLNEKLSPIEALFIRTGRNLIKLNLYTDTGVYIMDKALRKIARVTSEYSEDNQISAWGIRMILKLAGQYKLSLYSYDDKDGKHFLEETVKELVGESRYNAFLQEETRRQEAEYARELEKRDIPWQVLRARALASEGILDKLYG